MSNIQSDYVKLCRNSSLQRNRYFLLNGILYFKSFTGCEQVSSISCHCGRVWYLCTVDGALAFLHSDSKD